jgi:hypothetical protein
MTKADAPEPTRAKVLSAVRKHAITTGVTGGGLLAFFIPWALQVKDEVTAARHDIATTRTQVVEVRSEVAGVSRVVDTIKGDSVRISSLEASRASTETTLRFLGDRLDRIEIKLDRLLERK